MDIKVENGAMIAGQANVVVPDILTRSGVMHVTGERAICSMLLLF